MVSDNEVPSGTANESTGECCTCLTVVYEPEECNGGKLRERWICKMCGMEFRKRPIEDALREEIAELREGLRDLLDISRGNGNSAHVDIVLKKAEELLKDKG